MKPKKLIEEYKKSTNYEVWIDGALSNLIYGLLGSMVIVAITSRIDIAVILAYTIYYFYVGKVINRPKYVTSLGKFIVFPIPTAIGAFTGYKLAPYLIEWVI
tara:strand:+ start:1710 stop:2015 length:306 start_codon:yes stop_codon:yes gene_type:complete